MKLALTWRRRSNKFAEDEEEFRNRRDVHERRRILFPRVESVETDAPSFTDEEQVDLTPSESDCGSDSETSEEGWDWELLREDTIPTSSVSRSPRLSQPQSPPRICKTLPASWLFVEVDGDPDMPSESEDEELESEFGRFRPNPKWDKYRPNARDGKDLEENYPPPQRRPRSPPSRPPPSHSSRCGSVAERIPHTAAPASLPQPPRTAAPWFGSDFFGNLAGELCASWSNVLHSCVSRSE
uniref:Uncharacterized protein n=1 Tax=Chromera velia CCMP2878 TaxID=1169474 RepID=A0A0G4H3K6_9ALVE|eukprot:Cvel_24564.t1-p1 / transcript=Cvel_24564.t1 / gene=Cvel_24564 / organism=Chromera_velia_CCMP2878 / gene_product=hypothetical protein / transcript_product=hypothetical protein / location=Cvel_scaffold2672:17198-17914(-) / protein_length=239 / sequence_SO=supercontig / SO=protein_coding / is_pseudo=false